MSAITIQQMVNRISGLLEDRLQVRGADLAAKLKKVRHQLPGRVRQAADRLARAGIDSHNPKLLVQIDEGVVATDFDICVRHLMALPPRKRGLSALLRVAVSVGLGLLVLAGCVLVVRAWSGGF
jgi:hypothetical protein